MNPFDRHRNTNGHKDHPIFVAPASASLDILTTHCHDEHGARLCEELLKLDDEGIQASKERVVEVDKLRRAEAAGEVIVLD